MIPSTWFVLESFPLMSSGKIDKGEVKKWVEGMTAETLRDSECVLDHEPIEEAPDLTKKSLESIVEFLREAIGFTLNLPQERVILWRSFISLGGDSISALHLMSQCREHNMVIKAQDILRCNSVTELASCVEFGENKFSIPQAEELPGVPFGLSPIQQLYFQWEPEGTLSGGENRFNQSFLLRMKQPTSADDLLAALATLVARHSILRCRFVKSPSVGWQQVISADSDSRFGFEEHFISDIQELRDIIFRSQCRIDLTRGPLFNVDLINNSDGQMLSMIAHHAVIDLVSWRIIMRDLQHLLQGRDLPSQSSLSWPAWCKLQADYASRYLPPRVAFPQYANETAGINVEYWGMENETNTFKDVIRADIQLDSVTTSLLMSTECHQALRIEPLDLFLSAAIHSFSRVFHDRKVPTIYRESHGREPWDGSINISSTVGWFTTIYPISVEVLENGDIIETIRRVKDAQRQVPRDRWPYFASRFHHGDGIKDSQSPPIAEISFDYLGLYQQLESTDSLFEQESWENIDIGPEFNRPALFEITTEIIQGRLRMRFEYNKNMNRQGKIRRWIRECEEDLRHVVSVLDRVMYTPSDFPLLKMGYDGLDNLLTSILPNMGISPDNIEDVYNTSPMQTGVLISQSKDPVFYQCCILFRVDTISPFESVDAHRLISAWRGLVRRHSALRTIFFPNVSNSDSFVQVVLKDADVRVSRVFCSSAKLGRVLKAQESIQLHDPLPPHKMTIYDTDDGKVYMKINFSHASIDGASGEILVRDLLALYDGSQELPPAPCYRDFISLVQSYNQEEGLRYWDSCLSGVEPCHVPVLDDGVVQDRAFQIVPVSSPATVRQLTQWCQSCNITLSTLFKLVWSVVLGAYTGSDKICFGYIVSGRDDLDVGARENAMGVFTNMLTCRADLTGSLRAILNQIHEDSLRDLQHQYCSLAQIQRRTSSRKLGNQQPLFNTYLNFQLNRSRIARESSSISLNFESLYEPIDFSCIFDVTVTGEHLQISLAHCTTSVSPAQARNIASACTAALERVVQSPIRAPIKELSLMSEGSNNQIWTWNSTLPPRVDTHIHDIISHHAATNPSAPAVESYDVTFSYRQLDEITTRFSRHLAHLRIGTGCIVPLYFERSAWIIVSMIAVVKTGAAFVLLDPKHTSPARTSSMIMDTQAKIAIAGRKEFISLGAVIPELIIIVADSSLMEAIKSCTNCHYDENGLPNGIRASHTSARDPAYIIFTSGTTGKPKGSITSHAAFCTAAAAYGKQLGLSPSTRVLQVASYTFDVCLLEMLMVLLFRGCVYVPTEQDRANDIAGAINASQVNTMIITPSVAHLIAQSEVPTLKTLILTGESMSRADIECWKGHVRLINGYGPSECSVLCTVNDAVADDPLNIGKPAGSCCWIVNPDDHELLLPIGATGELIVESFALADGYFNDEAKTAESFIKPPQWLSGRRSKDSQVTRHVYKTGDLVRYNSDGSLCFIGRKDMQSKINGQRIEYGEIEDYLLSRCPFMTAVAVEVIKPEARQSRQALTAFFKFISAIDEIAHPTASPLEGCEGSAIFLGLSDDIINQLQTLKSSLAEVLPSFMIPSTFIPLEAFPLTSTGKLNRKVLREAAVNLSAEQLNRYSLLAPMSKYQALTSDIARRLRGAWAETLGAAPETITSDSNFFHLGGDSLSAMRLVLIAAKSYDITIAVVDIFKNSRLCDLARVARDRHIEIDITAPTPDIKPFSLLAPDEPIDEAVSMAALQCSVEEGRILDLYPCTALQEGLMMLSTTKQCAYVAQTVFRLPQTLDIYRLKIAWDAVVGANPILRTRIIRTEAGGCLQVVLDDSATWLFQDCPLERYLMGDMSIPVTWGAPLHRFAVLKTPDSAHTHLVWTAHHSLFDEWSQGLILEQLERAYNEEALPRLVPFNHFIAHITDSDDSLCATFWSAQLDGDMPASLPQVTSKTYVPRAESFHERVMAIRRGTETASQITTPTIIRAAWALAIGRYADAEDVIFGASLSGRGAPIPGIDRINGPTLSTVPIKVHIDRECPISEFLEAIQEQATDMMPFEHWGIQNIAQVSRNATFQNLLTVHPIRNSADETPLGLERVTKTHADYHIYPLIVECFLIDDNQVKLSIQYDVHVVPYAPQLASLFEQLISQLTLRSNDDSPLQSLVLCSLEDKARIFDWNREAPRVIDDCIHELISKNAKRIPEAEAIFCWDSNMTYADLDLLSSKLARHLAYLGVRPEKIVPALFEKSAWAIVTQLAILKAGGVMCMLDPSHPLRRLEDSIDTTDADLVLASETYSAVLQREGRTILTVGASTMHFITDACSVSTLPPVRSDHAAYVVFTSGTTGRPKASITEHRAFVSSSTSYAAAMQISDSTRALQHAAFSFDPYLLETFATLIQGGCVCVVKDEARSDVVELASAIRAMRVTWTAMVPSVARLLPRNDIPTLKTICLTGEPVSPTDRSLSDTVRLMNGYGPSECSVISALKDDITLDSDYTSIGRGVGSRCWIVEPHNHDILAPIGCIGELLLESPGLARGYLKEPKKTAEVFISSPVWLQETKPNTRMYKTGDLVRYNPDDGSISYVGRRDQQVKLHGQRLELGEIEYHILADDNVAIAAVTCPKFGPFKGKLVATLAFRLTTTTSINDPNLTLKLASQSDKFAVVRQLSEVQSRLERHLPSYMIPLVWTVVRSIPLTTSLKVNRRAIVVWLEAMDDVMAREVMELTHGEDHSFKASTTLERQLQDMIGQVLGLPTNRIFLNRSFIGLGGDSIAAIQLMARCRAVNMTFKLKDILKSKSISQLAELAAAIDSGARQRQDTQNRIKTGSELLGASFGLSPIQKLYFNSGAGQMQSQPSVTASSHWNLGVLLRLKRRVSVEILANAVKSIVEQHPMLRARFTYDRSENTWTQHIRPMTREVYSFQHCALESQDDMIPIISASQRHLDACKGSVFSVDSFEMRGSISQSGQQPEQYLFMVAHHLVIDLVSWRIVMHDMEEIIHTGKRPLSESFSFEDWVNMQEIQIATNTLQQFGKPWNLPSAVRADYRYWGISPDANLFGDTITTSLSLDIESTKALLGVCNRVFGTRPAELFVAALLDSFANVFGDRDLPPVCCEGHGRDCPWDSSIDLSSIVGWFTVIYPVQVQLGSDERGIIDTVRRVKDAHAQISETSLSSFASRLLEKEGSVAHHDDWPVEILFNFLGQHLQQEGRDTVLCPVTSPDVPGSPNYFNHDGTFPTTANVGPQCRRLALFDINVQISNDDRASVVLTFNRKSLYHDKIHLWISAYRRSLLSIVDELTNMPPERTLSDFPLMPLTYNDLDLLKSETIPALGLADFEEIEDIYPCGPTQKGILISRARSACTYHESFLYAITPRRSGPVMLERLAQAWKQVVARHTTLRTVFLDCPFIGEEGYCQIVLRSWEPPIDHLECTNDAAAVEQISKTRKASAFDSRGKLPTKPLHSILFCQTPDKVYMHLEISHALIDGESMPILIRDLAMAYEGIASLGTNPPRYQDYIAHIRSLPASDSITYWMNYIDGIQPCHIPTLADQVQIVSGGTHDTAGLQSIPIEFHESSEGIINFCRERNLTPMTVFHLAWALVLRMYTGQDDVCFGYLVSGRDIPVDNIEALVGVVCNVLILRMHLDSHDTGIELLLKAQDDWINSLPHQFVSQADVQHHRLQQRTKDTPSFEASKALFNTSVSFRSEGRSTEVDSHQPSLEFELLGGTEDFEHDATVSIWLSATTSFRGSFSYRASHISKGQAISIINTFAKAVKCLIGMSTQRLNEWSLVTENDAADFARFQCPQPIEVESSSTERPEFDGFIDEIIGTRAQEAPNREAVCSWDGRLTYRELESLSTRLANHLLVHHDVGPEVLVPICMEKSLWFVVSVLGVLKAGGAFVPLDANQPSRFQPLIEQAGAKFVLTSKATKEAISQISGSCAVVIDETLVTQSPTDRPLNMRQKRDQANTAYVIFTSGSTGTPKGVVIEHRAWVSSASGQIDSFGFDAKTRIFQFSSYSFDASIGEVLSTLMAGGCICIPSEAERLNDIEGAIARMNANVMFMAPSLSRALKPENVPSLHTIIIGGEHIPEREIQRWRGQGTLVSVYGPTECSMMASAIRYMTLADLVRPNDIGRPNRCKYWVVSTTDQNMLLPPGAIGELLIEGMTLARGYLGDATRTTAAFIENPRWAIRHDGEIRRMYRTGDIVQYQPEGWYKYMGRKDKQVQIRGQRVELGEVEHHLRNALDHKYPVAAEAVEVDGDAKLVAFVALGHLYESATANGLGHPLLHFMEKRQLQAAIAATAPSYMVFSAVIPLQDIPLLPSGKVDREKLKNIGRDFLNMKADTSPAVSPSTSDMVNRSTRPELTSTQQRMRKIWATVLSKDEKLIDLDASFLEQGGDSLLAIRLASACRSAGLVVSVSDILRKQGIKDICQDEEGDRERRPLGKSSSTTRASLSCLNYINDPELVQAICAQVDTDAANIENIAEATAMQSLFISTGLRSARGYTNYFSLHFRGDIDENRLKDACQALVAKHSILRTIFLPLKRRVFQVALRSLEPRFQVYKYPEEQQKKLAIELIEADQAEHVIIGQANLRFFFIHSKGHSTLVVRLSHAQYDGMSLRVLIGDLEGLYQNKHLSVRPAFANFVHAARERNGDGAEEHWRELLAGSTMTAIIPRISPRFRKTERRIVHREIAIPHEPQHRNVTLSTILKAAWALVLGELTHSTDVVFGHLITGRNMSVEGVDVNGILGPCLNIVPVRVKIQDSESLMDSDILEQIHSQQIAGIPFETLGMDKIVERCTDWPLWSQFSTVVQYQDLLDGANEAINGSGFSFGDLDCHLTAFEGEYNGADIVVLATPQTGNTNIDIALQYDDEGEKRGLTLDYMRNILDRLVDYIAMFSSTPGGQLQSKISQKPSPLLTQVPTNGNEGTIYQTATMDTSGYRFEDMPAMIRDIVTNAWESILSPLPGQFVRECDKLVTESTPFYDVWGNLIAASQFVALYADNGVQTTAEEMIENPSKLAQGMLIAARMHIALSPLMKV